MYITRDIFYLKFGHFKEAKSLLDDISKKGSSPKASAGAHCLILPATHTASFSK